VWRHVPVICWTNRFSGREAVSEPVQTGLLSAVVIDRVQRGCSAWTNVHCLRERSNGKIKWPAVSGKRITTGSFASTMYLSEHKCVVRKPKRNIKFLDSTSQEITWASICKPVNITVTSPALNLVFGQNEEKRCSIYQHTNMKNESWKDHYRVFHLILYLNTMFRSRYDVEQKNNRLYTGSTFYWCCKQNTGRYPTLIRQLFVVYFCTEHLLLLIIFYLVVHRIFCYVRSRVSKVK
jgi:hypothetical protein